jgi:arabinogalactan endo-1,4-beta-galactosidase
MLQPLKSTWCHLENEIRNGMLWLTGKVNLSKPSEFANLSILYKAACDGVSDAVRGGLSAPRVMVHIDNGWDREPCMDWFTGLILDWSSLNKRLGCHRIVLSPLLLSQDDYCKSRQYPSMGSLTLKYSKPIMVLETDYPVEFIGKYKPKAVFSEPSISISERGQLDWVKRTIDTL